MYLFHIRSPFLPRSFLFFQDKFLLYLPSLPPFSFKTSFYSAFQAGFELMVIPYLSLLSAGITGVHHHTASNHDLGLCLLCPSQARALVPEGRGSGCTTNVLSALIT